MLEIVDLGNGVIEVTTKEEGLIVNNQLVRKSDFNEVNYDPSWSYVSIEGRNPVTLKYDEISKIGSVDSPASNQAVYNEIKAMMIV